MSMTLSRRGLWSLLIVALLMSPAAHADKKVDALMVSAQRCYEELNYGCAISKLREAQARIADKKLTLPVERRVAVYQTLAFALASVEKHDEAAAVFELCLGIKPDYSLDPKVISPKIYADYRRARHKTLSAVLDLKPMTPPLPSVHGPGPPRVRDYELHVPSTIVLGGRLEPEEDKSHRLDFLAGVKVLFGGDGENFNPGFGLAVQYAYSVTESFEVGLITLFSQHTYSGDDVKPGFPSTLYVLDPGLVARYVLRFGEYVDLGVGVALGASVSGIGTLGDINAAWFSADISVMITPSPEFGFGLSTLPGVVIARLESGDVRTSFTLPVLVRFEARF